MLFTNLFLRKNQCTSATSSNPCIDDYLAFYNGTEWSFWSASYLAISIDPPIGECDIFDDPTQIINYLEMREELERHIKYKGDELDLIALYMDNHLNLADINPEFPLMITGMSKKIDDYYVTKALQLYLDFINLFIRLIEFFGKRNDN